MLVEAAFLRARTPLSSQNAEVRVYGEISLPSPNGLAVTRAANLREAHGPFSFHSVKPRAFSFEKSHTFVSRRRRNVRHLCTTLARRVNCGPLGQIILRGPTGARAGSFKPNRNRAIPSSGAEEDLGALISHNGRPQLCIRRDAGRIAHLSLGIEQRHDFPHQGLPSCRLSRCQRRSLPHPRTVRILAQAGSRAPIALTRNLDKAFR